MSYVSENDMKEFFQNVIDQVATLSTQASKVEGLEQRVNELYSRLSQLEDENRNLHAQIADANNTVQRMTSELDQAHRSFDNERAVTNSLRDTIVQRDAGVVALENSFRQEQDSHKITTSERDDARTKVNELETSLERAYAQFNDISTDRDHWRSLATDLERQLSQVKGQLEKIQSVLNPLRVVSSDVA